MRLSERIKHRLDSYRFTFYSEADLQRCISETLTREGIFHEREVRMRPPALESRHPSFPHVRGLGDIRLDFLCDEGLAIEIKVAANKNRSSLIRQLHRYTLEDRISEVLVISDGVFADVPECLNSKPIIFHFIRSAF